MWGYSLNLLLLEIDMDILLFYFFIFLIENYNVFLPCTLAFKFPTQKYSESLLLILDINENAYQQLSAIKIKHDNSD